MKFTYCEDRTAIVKLGNKVIHLNQVDIQQVWCQTAELFDIEHEGPASIYFASKRAIVSEEEWQKLYYLTTRCIDDILHMHEEETKVLH